MTVEITEHEQMETNLWLSQQIGSAPCLGAGVTHDLINYLAVADSYMSLLLMDADPGGRMHRVLTEAAHAVQESIFLARHLLRLNRTGTRHLQKLSIRDFVVGMESMLSHLVGRDIELIVSSTPDVGLVQADPQEVERLLLNLVVNARQAITGTGTITLLIANAQADEINGKGIDPKPYVTISVSDTGIGMDRETCAHIFEPFFTARKDGTGIGLAIVHAIVARSQGSIRVESKLGCGTTFTVYLPRVDAHEIRARCERGQDS